MRTPEQLILLCRHDIALRVQHMLRPTAQEVRTYGSLVLTCMQFMSALTAVKELAPNGVTVRGVEESDLLRLSELCAAFASRDLSEEESAELQAMLARSSAAAIGVAPEDAGAGGAPPSEGVDAGPGRRLTRRDRLSKLEAVARYRAALDYVLSEVESFESDKALDFNRSISGLLEATIDASRSTIDGLAAVLAEIDGADDGDHFLVCSEIALRSLPLKPKACL